MKKARIPDDVMRLTNAVDYHYREAERYRLAQKPIIQRVVGSNYGESAIQVGRVPFMLLALYLRAIVQHTAPKNPKALVTTAVGPWKPYQPDLEYNLNWLAHTEELARKVNRWCTASQFSIGILKIASEYQKIDLITGGTVSAPSPYIEVGDISRFVWDTRSSELEQATFMGDCPEQPIDDALENDTYTKEARDKLERVAAGHFDDLNDETRTRLSDVRNRYQDDYVRYLHTWEIYDQHKNRKLAWPVGMPEIQLFGEEGIPWTGPTGGPYHLLYYQTVPDHPFPISPMMPLLDLDENCNILMRRVINQARQHVRVTTYNGTDDEEFVKQLMKAGNSGCTVKATRGAVDQVDYGGPHQPTLMLAMMLRDAFGYMAGGLETYAGLKSGAETATEAKLLHATSNRLVEDMQEVVTNRLSKVYRSLAHYVMADEIREMTVPRRIPGTKMHVHRKWTPELRRRLDVMLFDIGVDVYSTRNRSPDQRFAEIMAGWQQLIMPLAEMGAVRVDGEELIRIFADYKDLDEVSDIVMFNENPTPPLGQAAPKMPRETLGPGSGSGQTSRDMQVRQMLSQPEIGDEDAGKIAAMYAA